MFLFIYVTISLTEIIIRTDYIASIRNAILNEKVRKTLAEVALVEHLCVGGVGNDEVRLSKQAISRQIK
jgi:hypothetical protein